MSERGAWPNRTSIIWITKRKPTYDALVTVKVIYDMARAQRDYFFISIFNDLRGCCDRVHPSLNTITTMQIGLPESMAICHAAALRKMRHYLRTGFGISEEYLQGNEMYNPRGDKITGVYM